jgi:hypothetical protein
VVEMPIEVRRIKEGLFFPEDFVKLPKGTMIFIKDGKLINEVKKRKVRK